MPKKKRKKRKLRLVFPIIYPNRIGTPTTYRPGDTNEFGGGTSNQQVTPPDPGPTESKLRPSRARVLHEMRKALGQASGSDRSNMGGDAFKPSPLVEYFNNAPQVAWGGYSIPSFSAAVTTRGAGPFISGPGFQMDYKGDTGRYDFQKSPGLGFRTEQAWKIWEQALKIIDREPNLSKASILLRAMAKSGIHRGQIDPAEYRLLEMGIDWYLSDAGALGARRDIFY